MLMVLSSAFRGLFNAKAGLPLLLFPMVPIQGLHGYARCISTFFSCWWLSPARVFAKALGYRCVLAIWWAECDGHRCRLRLISGWQRLDVLYWSYPCHHLPWFKEWGLLSGPGTFPSAFTISALEMEPRLMARSSPSSIWQSVYRQAGLMSCWKRCSHIPALASVSICLPTVNSRLL